MHYSEHMPVYAKLEIETKTLGKSLKKLSKTDFLVCNENNIYSC